MGGNLQFYPEGATFESTHNFIPYQKTIVHEVLLLKAIF